MKRRPAILISLLLLLLLAYQAGAQNLDERFRDSLVKKFQYYRIKKREGVLFAHFDKTIYSNSENVWFTAYLLNNNQAEKNDVVSVVLVNDEDRSVVLKEKFVMEKGIAVGNLFVPDSVVSGNYTFLMYTNNVVNGQPENSFLQPVTIKNTNDASFSAELSRVEDGEPNAAPQHVRLVTSAKGTTIVAYAGVVYFIGNEQHPIVAGKVKTDRAGQYVFDVPPAAFTLGNNIIQARIRFGKETKTVKLILPPIKSVPSVRFYPEGGYLVNDVLSNVGWEVKGKTGDPYETTAVLFKDGKPVDTISTDSYGMGVFRLKPAAGSRYTAKLLLGGVQDSTFTLPIIAAGQPVVDIAKAVVNDTLDMVLKARDEQDVFVVLHDYKHVFYAFPVKINAAGRPVKIALKAFPKGIAEVTVLDSLHRPCAERLFFAHYDQRDHIGIKTDNNEYKTRQHVTLSLDLKDRDGKPLSGLVSVACIQANRTELRKSNNIESYVYLNFDLGRLPVKQNVIGAGAADLDYLEKVLLIKGWRRYTWQELANAAPKDTIKAADSLLFTGRVSRFDAPLKKPQVLAILRDSVISSVTTDAKGDFVLRNPDLYVIESKNVNLMPVAKSQDGFAIKITDPYDAIDEQLLKSYHPINYTRFWLKKGDDSDPENGNERMIHLKQVEINAGNDNSMYVANGCGDYVCMFNILNCVNHKASQNNKPPVKYGHYKTWDELSRKYVEITYMGCDLPLVKRRNLIEMEGIKFAMEFYPSDYKQFNPPTPEYLSTVFWKDLYEVKPEGSEPLTFYTGDITGDFKIIVQGVSGNDVVYGEKYFKVSKP